MRVLLDDVLATFVWIHVTKARFQDRSQGVARNQKSALWTSVNFRNILSQDVPSNYFGNAYICVPTPANIADLLDACDVNHSFKGLAAFAVVALSIRQKIASVDRAYIMRRFTLAKSCSDPRQFKARFFPNENRDIVFENRSELCNGYDFSKIPGTGGQKKPSCIRMVHPKPDNGVLVVQPTDTQMSEGLIEVQIPLWEDDMRRLERLGTWKEKVRMVW